MTLEEAVEYMAAELCSFDGGCEECESQGRTWTHITQIPEDVAEADWYRCDACLVQLAVKIKAYERWCDSLIENHPEKESLGG